MKELDKHRSKVRYILTDEQKKFILKCREHANPVPYSQMSVLWKKLGWGYMAETSIRNHYKKMQSDK